MKVSTCLISALLLLCVIVSTDIGCPEDCSCSHWKIKCLPSLNETQLHTYLASLSRTITLLTLSNNTLTIFPYSLCHLSITQLDISHNQIKTLEYQSSCLRQLRYFTANDNEIWQIDSRFFNDMTYLVHVDIKRNLLVSLDPNTFIWPALGDLRFVDLSENKLQEIDLWPMKMPYFKRSRGPYASTKVNVSQNEIEKVVNTVNFHPTQVTREQFLYFDLTHNKLHSLKEILINNFEIKNPLDLMGMWDISYILYHNEFYCDCDMFEVMRIAKPFIPFFKKTLAEQLIYMVCFKPDRVKDRVIYKLPDEEFQCSISNCTYTGQCDCVKTPANKTLRVECREQTFNGLPKIARHAASGIIDYEFYVTNGSINSLDLKPFGTKLSVLDVSSNNLSSLQSDFFSYLTDTKHILLRNNKLQTLPRSVEHLDLRGIRELTLGGNPFICDCSSLWLKEWMQKHLDKISDIIAVNCAFPEWNKGKFIMEVKASDFVCSKIDVGMAVGLPLGFLIVLLCFVGMLSYFRDYIKLLLFSRFGWRFSYDYSNEERTYDLFVSYSRHDEEWVEQTFTNTLEGHDPPYRVCLHYKDFEPGIPIAENINRAVEESHCTVLTVSANFLESEWCRYEFRLAHNDAITKRSTKVIVILLEPVAHLDLDRDLKMYLKTNTYLAKSDPRFWNRLLMALPKPSGKVRDFPELQTI